MNPDLIKIMDILWDEPERIPDLGAISEVIQASKKPIALVQGLVYLLWLASERPDDFDVEVARLMAED